MIPMTKNKTNLELIDEDEICREIMLQHPNIYTDLDWNEYNIKERLEKNPFHYQQFRMLWLSEKHKLRKIEMLKDEYTGQLYDNLRYNGEKSLSKTEIEKYYLPKDEKVMKFNRLYMRQEIRVGVYEEIANAFKMQGFALGNYVKALAI
jgi:hypothetical protein